MSIKRSDSELQQAVFSTQLANTVKAWVGGTVLVLGLLGSLYGLTLSPIHAQIEKINGQVQHSHTDTELIKEKISNIQENIKNIYDLMKQKTK